MFDFQTPLNLVWRRALPIKDPSTFRTEPGRYVVLREDGFVESITDGVVPPIMKQTVDRLPDDIYESEDVRGGKSVAVIESSFVQTQVQLNNSYLCLVDGDGNPYVYTHGALLTVACKSGPGQQCQAQDLGKYVIAQIGDPVYAILDDILSAFIFLIRKFIGDAAAAPAPPALTPPQITDVAPIAGSLMNDLKVSYTLSKRVSSASITWERTGGTADPASPHVQQLTTDELTPGAHTDVIIHNPPSLVSGAIYSIKFNASDNRDNPAKEVVVANVSYDTIMPVISNVAPSSGSGVNDAKVSYTLSEEFESGKVTWTRVGGAADPASPQVCDLEGDELDSGLHSDIELTNAPTLVDSTIYDVKFEGVDVAGNPAAPVTSSAVTFDTATPIISGTAPAENAKVKDTKVSYTVSEALAAGKVTFTQTGGTADPASPHVCDLEGGELAVGAHNDITLTNAPTLVGGAIYTVKFEGEDAAGNVATPVENTGITYDVVAPVISSVAPVSDATVNDAKVSFTLSEDVASGSVTWERTSGTADPASPQVCALAGAELASGAHANIDLTNAPTLVSGAIYSVTFNATDAAGNQAVPVVNTNVTYTEASAAPDRGAYEKV